MTAISTHDERKKVPLIEQLAFINYLKICIGRKDSKPETLLRVETLEAVEQLLLSLIDGATLNLNPDSGNETRNQPQR